MELLVKANTQFAYDIFQEFLKLKKDNIFYSPISMSSALGMVFLGARGNTALEFQKTLHLDAVTECTAETTATRHEEKSEIVHHQFQKLLTELNQPTDAYELNIANRLYGEETYQFLQGYLDDIKKFYLTTVESVDFANAPEESRVKINSWVESQTNEKIKDLFPDGTISNNTALVLVNAVYFKGQWDQKFNKERTEEAEFWLNKDTSKSVQMMKQSESFNFASLEDVQAKILEIPYKGKDLSMVVLLPNEADGLGQLEDKLTSEKLIEWMSSQNMNKRQVDLCLPKFKVEESYDLKATLEAMGIVDAFSPQGADLSGMTGSRDLVVSKIMHKSYVEVTEEGTEAAAATGALAVPMSMPIRENFCCNRPFLFFIRHNKTQSILFFGRVSCP
ncbi:serpin B4 [Tupaia chinensis]|uniref:Serpin B4 n=1 Tax=Tupaia chinensis TaxID=246437 RepID=L9LBZ2_TUPCH|nr:serpin B4 [Tupaia chinensis]ELW71272.1 Serpin B4 [Tupaia chinensis]